MAANHKLTALIARRTVVAVESTPPSAHVHFDDGSTMTIQLAAGASAFPQLGRVHAVRQQGTTLNFDYDTNTTLTFQTAEPTASVMLRAKDGTLEYAD